MARFIIVQEKGGMPLVINIDQIVTIRPKSENTMVKLPDGTELELQIHYKELTAIVEAELV